jgi:hypothetical protein
VWVSGSGLAVLGTAMLFAADAPANWQRRLMLLVLPGFVPVITTMHAGQVNAFVLLAAVLALAAWRQQRPVVGGAWLALSFWLKPLVIALVGLLLWRGHWRALGGFVAGSLLITLAGVLAFGPEPTLTQRSGAEVSAALSGQPMPFPPVQNLRGLLSRWLTPHPHGAALLDMSQHFAPVYPALLLVGGIILLVLFWPPGRRGRPLDIEAALLIVSTLLLAPFTWFHHLTLLFIGFAVLITRWSDWRRHRWELAALGAAYVSLAVHGLLWKLLDGSTLLLDGGTWASLLLWVLLVRQLFYERTAALYPAVGDGEETDASHDHTSKYSQKEP